jgi:predicted ATPase with chaperone activity
MSVTAPVFEVDPELVRSLLTDDVFEPVEPATLDQAGLTDAFVEALICKDLSVNGTARGRALSDNVGLPFNIIARLLESLRTRKLVAHASGAQFNDYSYMLTELGAARAHQMLRECAYVGPAPVRLPEYVMSVAAQSIAHEAPGRERLVEACKGISVDPKLFRSLGPAINSGGAIFLYGAPGNGKSTLARQITMCFGQRIWVPHAIIDGGHVIKFYDSQFHRAVEDVDGTLLRSTSVDRRWIQIHRPTVVVGGELTLDNLELRHHPDTKICEAPLQMKSNCGCLLIDDFGRQRIAPADLLNRWIVPLESHHDYLTLPTGKKLQVPFQQIVIFSTNLEPEDLVDEAFLRRIPYKIHTADPTDDEFYFLFQLYCNKFGCEYRKDVVTYLLDKYYRPCRRAKRRCHARDLLAQVRNHCRYNGVPLELLPEYFDLAVENYFAMISIADRP